MMHENLYKYRKAHNLTQEQMANALGMQRASYQKYESGQVVQIPVELLERMAHVGIDLDELIANKTAHENEALIKLQAQADRMQDEIKWLREVLAGQLKE